MRKHKALNQVAMNALEKITFASVESHTDCMKFIKNSIQKLNYTEKDLKRMQKYIAFKAPIIIHFKLAFSIRKFIQDKKYKNLFETNTSGGCKSQEKRKVWENYLFGNSYDFATGKERIKYGVMNFVNDHRGFE